MHVYTLVELKSNRIGLLIVELRHLELSAHVRNGIGLCVELCSAHETEVGDDSLVVVAVE